MTRQLHLLTAPRVAGLKDPGRYADGGNLYLRVSPTGGKAVDLPLHDRHQEKP